MYNNFQLPEGLLDGLSDEQLQNILKDQSSDVLRSTLEKLSKQVTVKAVKSKEYEQLNQKQLDELVDKEGGLMIEPTPGYVFKTHYNNHEKLFINICEHFIVDEPEEKEMLDLEEGQSGIRIPMSVGSLKEDHDKQNNVCRVVDVVLHPNVVNSVKTDEPLKQFLKQLLITYLNDKYKITLNPNFKMIKLKYKGKTVQLQRVKAKKAPRIQTMDEEIGQQQQDLMQQQKDNIINEQAIPVAEFNVYLVDQDGNEDEFDGDFDIKQVNKLLIKVQLPLLVTGRHIKLMIGKNHLQMNNGKIYKLALSFPFFIHPSSAQAVFENSLRELHITLKPLLIKTVPDQQNPQPAEKSANKQNIDIQLQSQDLYEIF